MLEGILIAAAIIGGLSILIGILLGVIGKIFAVQTDEREVAVRGALPGNNCGGCGFAGCDALAKAIAVGEAPVNACPVGGNDAAKAIAAVMGVEATETERQVAYVQCAGTCDKAKLDYHYFGANDCRQAAVAPGHAGKACSFGCYGFGTCASVCSENAIRIADGIAQVDPALCKGCGQCVKACPQHLIAMRPESAKVAVRCSSNAAGKAVKAACAAGCIGCGICQKNCPSEAIKVENNVARVDQTLCTGCGVCESKCPVKVIELL